MSTSMDDFIREFLALNPTMRQTGPREFVIGATAEDDDPPSEWVCPN